MPTWLIQFLIPFAFNAISDYVKNSDSSSDDKVLEVVKIGADYLKDKHNNNVTEAISNSLNNTSMTKIQG